MKDSSTISTGLTLLLALAGGVAVANLYYAQPLLAPIGAALAIPAAATGFAMTVTQVGYGLGMLLVVPLADRFENRRLIVSAFCVVAAALVCMGLARSPLPFMVAAFLCGLAASVAQVIVPFASHLAAPEERGRAVGNVLSGLLLGMMMARPLSSMVADLFGWRAIFLLSAGIVALVATALWRFAPRRHPTDGFLYSQLLGSMLELLRTHGVLRRRAGVQFFLFGAFTMFWTAVPLLLMGPHYDMTQRGVALFALVGVTGAAAAPLVGRAADRGRGALGALVALAACGATFLIALAGQGGSLAALGALVTAGILIDIGVAASLVISTRVVLTLGSGARSRLNGLFYSIFYSGGAVGSALGAWAYVVGGWTLVCAFGLAMTLAAFALHLIDTRR